MTKIDIIIVSICILDYFWPMISCQQDIRKNYRFRMKLIENGKFFVFAYFDSMFSGKEPWQISTITASSVLMSIWLWNFIFQQESLTTRAKRTLFATFRKIPYVAKQIDAEQKKIFDMLQSAVIETNKDVPYKTTLPLSGMSKSDVLNSVQSYLKLGKYKWSEGYVSGTVYYFDDDLIDLLTDVYRLTSYTNPLHPDVFPGICKMEAEIIKMVINLFHGNENCCGSMTSGGTESILMACKAYRDYARETRGVKYPEVVLPLSAHAAFDKAGSYFGIQMKHITLDPDNMAVNLKAMENAISRNTIMLVGSVPNFPHGIMDDMEKIAQLGLKYRIPVHVDCCLGSFIVAFMPSVGYPVPAFDFQLPGITSISVDTHKYGFAPKGSSLVLYSDRKYHHHQYFVSLSWPGGHYGSPSVGGSRAGAIIASCWTTFMYFGLDGYKKATKDIINVAKYIEDELRKIDGIFIFGKPLSTVIAMGSNKFHIYRLAEALNKRNWSLNTLQFPFGIHICLTQLHTLDGVADRFLTDVQEEVINILKTPKVKLTGVIAMYGMSATLPDRSLVGDFTKLYIDALYYTPSSNKETDGNELNC